MSSVTGENLKLSIFGESHGEAIGCVIDGLPAGMQLDMQRIALEMGRRAPGKNKTATPRVEQDTPHILSGVLEGVTTGAPLAMVIENTNTRSGDYEKLRQVPRPGHSDYPAYVRYGGYNDIRGGGHFSGRLTAPLVFAGAVAKQFLAGKGITVGAHILRIGSETESSFTEQAPDELLLERLTDGRFPVRDEAAGKRMKEEIEKYRTAQDSIGGVIECAVLGVPVGVGGNMFSTVESKLSAMLFGIPAVKGVAFGLGFGFGESCASQVNDEYEIRDGKVGLLSNNNGGVLGGITTGAPIIFSVAIKPTPSIAKPQRSVNLETMENEVLEIKGRHDPCIVPRAVPVVEAAAALTVLDLLL